MAENRSDRREFLRTGLATAAVGLGCLRFGLREALAQARSTGKPLLTEENVNTLVPTNAAAHRAMALEARRDFKGFVRRHFTLTPAQEKALDAMSDSDTVKIQKAIDLALQKRYRLQVKVARPTGRQGQVGPYKYGKVGSPGARRLPDVGGKEESPGWSVGGVEVKASGSYDSSTREFEGTVSITFSCPWG